MKDFDVSLVMKTAAQLDVTRNPDPLAIFIPRGKMFQIYATMDDNPGIAGWNYFRMTAGEYSKPCCLVARVFVKKDDEGRPFLELQTQPNELKDARLRKKEDLYNHPVDVAWAKTKIHWLMDMAGVECPEIKLVELIQPSAVIRLDEYIAYAISSRATIHIEVGDGVHRVIVWVNMEGKAISPKVVEPVEYASASEQPHKLGEAIERACIRMLEQLQNPELAEQPDETEIL